MISSHGDAGSVDPYPNHAVERRHIGFDPVEVSEIGCEQKSTSLERIGLRPENMLDQVACRSARPTVARRTAVPGFTERRRATIEQRRPVEQKPTQTRPFASHHDGVVDHVPEERLCPNHLSIGVPPRIGVTAEHVRATEFGLGARIARAIRA